MSVSIRISDKEYLAAKKAARVEHRSIRGQVEFWAKIGRCALENPDLPIEMIKDLLVIDLKDLSDATPFTFEQKCKPLFKSQFSVKHTKNLKPTKKRRLMKSFNESSK